MTWRVWVASPCSIHTSALTSFHQASAAHPSPLCIHYFYYEQEAREREREADRARESRRSTSGGGEQEETGIQSFFIIISNPCYCEREKIIPTYGVVSSIKLPRSLAPRPRFTNNCIHVGGHDGKSNRQNNASPLRPDHLWKLYEFGSKFLGKSNPLPSQIHCHPCKWYVGKRSLFPIDPLRRIKYMELW